MDGWTGAGPETERALCPEPQWDSVLWMDGPLWKGPGKQAERAQGSVDNGVEQGTHQGASSNVFKINCVIQ